MQISTKILFIMISGIFSAVSYANSDIESYTSTFYFKNQDVANPVNYNFANICNETTKGGDFNCHTSYFNIAPGSGNGYRYVGVSATDPNVTGADSRYLMPTVAFNTRAGFSCDTNTGGFIIDTSKTGPGGAKNQCDGILSKVSKALTYRCAAIQINDKTIKASDYAFKKFEFVAEIYDIEKKEMVPNSNLYYYIFHVQSCNWKKSDGKWNFPAIPYCVANPQECKMLDPSNK